jgi:hypothetical protein
MGFPWFLVLLTCFAAGVFVWLAVNIRWGKQSEWWPDTEGTVLTSRTRRQGGDVHSRQYLVDVRYEYEVGGQVYTSGRRTFGRKHITGWQSAHDVADEYPSGATVRVYYHPDNPKLAVLEPGIVWDNAVLMVVCVIALFFGLRSLLGRL